MGRHDSFKQLRRKCVAVGYPPPSDRPSDERPQPDWALVHRELRRPNVTLMLLWEEYCDASSDSFSYSWFCERYKEWAGCLKPTLRQVHVADEKKDDLTTWGQAAFSAQAAIDLAKQAIDGGGMN
jgi:transposase